MLIEISFPQGAQQQTRRTPPPLPIDVQTDGRTDGRWTVYIDRQGQ